MDENIRFIEDNYIEEKVLCSQAKISIDELNGLIENELLPNASFVIETQKEIKSPLGDQTIIRSTSKYYSKNTLELIEENRETEQPPNIKERFKAEFIKALSSCEDRGFAYGNILGPDGKFDADRLNQAFEEEWKYYCKGIYGICTLNANAEEIAKKEIAVKKLIDFNQKYKDKELSLEEKSELKQLNDEYNSISNLFAPYQRKTSSRGKYLDEILKQNAMTELIKKYN